MKRVGKRGEFSLPPDVLSAVGIVERDLVEFEVLRIVKPPSRRPETQEADGQARVPRIEP